MELWMDGMLCIEIQDGGTEGWWRVSRRGWVKITGKGGTDFRKLKICVIILRTVLCKFIYQIKQVYIPVYNKNWICKMFSFLLTCFSLNWGFRLSCQIHYTHLKSSAHWIFFLVLAVSAAHVQAYSLKAGSREIDWNTTQPRKYTT